MSELRKPKNPNGVGHVTAPDAIKSETLIGDVRDLLLQEARDAKDGLPWPQRGEKAQEEFIDRVDRFSRHLVEQIVQRVAARGERSIGVQIKQWRVKDGIQIQVDAHTSLETITALAESGNAGRLVFTDIEQFVGERAPVRPSPDQRRMFDGDSKSEEGEGDGATA